MPLVGRVSGSDRPAVAAVPAAALTAAPTARRNRPAACRSGRQMHTHVARDSRKSDARERSFFRRRPTQPGPRTLKRCGALRSIEQMLRCQRGRSRRRGRVARHGAKRVPGAPTAPPRGAYVLAWCSLSASASGRARTRRHGGQNCRKEICSGQCCAVRRASHPSHRDRAARRRRSPGRARTPGRRTTAARYYTNVTSTCLTYIRVADGPLLDLRDLCILPLMTSVAYRRSSRARAQSHALALS